MKASRAWPWVIFIIGLIFDLIGVVLMVIYAVEAIIKRVGEADQSLMFWYLPILFVGLAILAVGISLSGLSLKKIRQFEKDEIDI